MKAIIVVVIVFFVLCGTGLTCAYMHDRDRQVHCAEWETEEYGSIECIGTTCVHITRQVEKCVRRDDDSD